MSKSATLVPALLTFGLLLTAGTANASEADERAVREASTQFYAALNAMFTGDVAPMKSIWSHADDVTYLGPAGGLQVGWDKVLTQWEAQAALKLGGKVTPEKTTMAVGQTLAVTQNYEKGENVNADGERQTVSIRATNVFRKENGRWKMISHHTDLLPFLEQ